MPGRIDVHSHLLPGVDDGCETLEESIQCARALVDAGYSHSFCTPHIWPSFPKQSVAAVTEWTAGLQKELDSRQIPLVLMTGGEIGLRPDLPATMGDDRLLTYGGAGKYCLVDLWADVLPEFFAPVVKWFQAKCLTVILAHPERMRAVQDDPELMDYFIEMGLLLQGNLQCLGEPRRDLKRRLAEQFLLDGKYFMLGTDLHKIDTLGDRLQGLQNAIDLAGEEAVNRLTIENPAKLL